jgi:acyl-CoA synthetase (AMP-forming)/AMP-acid ligase II
VGRTPWSAADALVGPVAFMNGLMMDYPLTLTHILERSAKIYPDREIASRVEDGSMHRCTYGDFHRRESITPGTP